MTLSLKLNLNKADDQTNKSWSNNTINIQKTEQKIFKCGHTHLIKQMLWQYFMLNFPRSQFSKKNQGNHIMEYKTKQKILSI